MTSSNRRTLDGKVALVSAAGRGIGRAIAIGLAEAGASVAVNSYGEETTNSTAEAVRATGSDALPLAGDITDPDTILSAAHDDTLRAEASAGWREAKERDGIFGVPSFRYAGRLYWGQDRMHFLRSAVVRKSGRES